MGSIMRGLLLLSFDDRLECGLTCYVTKIRGDTNTHLMMQFRVYRARSWWK